MFIRYCHLWHYILVTLVDTLPTIEVVIATGYDIQAIPYYLDPALVYILPARSRENCPPGTGPASSETYVNIHTIYLMCLTFK